MAIAFVSAWTGKQNASNAGGSTAAKAVTAGNFLVIATSGDLNPPGTVTTSVTDTVAQANASASSSSDFIRLQYVVSAVGGASVTIGISHTSPHFSAITAAEYSGLDATTPLDQHSTAGTGSGSTLTSASVTTTVADELIITHGTIVAATDNVWAAGASNTMRSQTNLDSVSSCTFVQERIVASTGSYSATATKSPGSGAWIMGIATFKAAAGGGTTTVVVTRATTWNTNAAVAVTRATTWNTNATLVVTRATTWNTKAALVVTRATTWNVGASVVVTRATTWNTLASVVVTRSTTWNVLSSLTTVAVTRATTWNTRALVVATRATTWNVLVIVVPTYIFRPPVVHDRDYGPERLWRRIATAGRGVNVFQLADGSYVEKEPVPGTVILHTYLGGHDNPIDATERASLIAAGYGPDIV